MPRNSVHENFGTADCDDQHIVVHKITYLHEIAIQGIYCPYEGPDYDSDSDLSKKSANFIRNMAWVIVYQKYRIFIGKCLENPRFVWTGEEHGVNIVEEKLGIDVEF
jgi:hypothetical protein